MKTPTDDINIVVGCAVLALVLTFTAGCVVGARWIMSLEREMWLEMLRPTNSQSQPLQIQPNTNRVNSYLL